MKVLFGLAAMALVLSSAIPVAAQSMSVQSAADLRTTLNDLLLEHVYLDGLASIAIMHGNTGEVQAAAATLDQNNTELGQLVGMAFGPDAQQAFLQVWNAHVGLLKDYARAAAAHDNAAKQQALAGLNANRQDVDSFFTQLIPKLPKGSVAQLLIPHVTTLAEFMDALAADDPSTAFAKLQEAAHHMQMLADPLAAAIATQFPDKFQNVSAIDSGWADLRVRLNLAFDEHAYLIYYAAQAELAGRKAEFEAAVATRDQNTAQLGSVLGVVYSPDLEKAFLDVWREHVDYFALYSQGVATKDANLKQAALVNLDEYSRKLDDLFSGTNPKIARGSIVNLLAPHITSLIQAIDALAANDPATAFQKVQESGHHMQMLSDTLALAIGTQFPDKFGPGAPAMAPVTGGSQVGPTATGSEEITLLAVILSLLVGSFVLRTRRGAVER